MAGNRGHLLMLRSPGFTAIELMLALPLQSLAGMALQREIDQIGKVGA